MSHHNSGLLSWSGWGNPDLSTTLSPELRQLLTSALRVSHPGPAVPDLTALSPRPSRIRSLPGLLPRLEAIIGADHVLLDDASRVRHTRGKSTPDLLRLRLGDLNDAPDAIALPRSHDEVAAVLRLCAAERIAVVPFGGGTSVVGGLSASAAGFAATLALDLGQMRRLLALDEISRTATFEPGLRGPDAEALLSEHGFTLGHFPQSFEYATIGGFAATRSSGQSSAGYGRFDELVVGIRMATPRGTLELGDAPHSAAGPDLRQLLLGSEGSFGVITAVTVEVVPSPAVRRYEGWRLESFTEGTELTRRLAQDGPRPTVLRLSDEVETAINAIQAPDGARPAASGGCLAIVGFEGIEPEVSTRQAAVAEILRAHGATPVPGAGEAWLQGRFQAPYLRDAMLDAGVLVETLETAGFWSSVPRLYEAVRSALVDSLQQQGTAPVVLCHISHVYRSGASLYFTVACAQAEDPLEQWSRAKSAACDAILDTGGTITHHHGVGRDHRPWLARQLGEPAGELLRAVKHALDPEGVMNPGALIP